MARKSKSRAVGAALPLPLPPAHATVRLSHRHGATDHQGEPFMKKFTLFTRLLPALLLAFALLAAGLPR